MTDVKDITPDSREETDKPETDWCPVEKGGLLSFHQIST